MSVTEVTRAVRSALEAGVGDVWVEGEISNYRQQASGHQYFTLKDSECQLACAHGRLAAADQVAHEHLDVKRQLVIDVGLRLEAEHAAESGKHLLSGGFCPRTPLLAPASAKATARPRRSAFGAKAGARRAPIAPLRSARLARCRSFPP